MTYLKNILCLLLVFILTSLAGYYVHPHLFPPVSVVLPTYNRADLLPRAIRSFFRQTYPYFELIIVDDASTDNSVEIIKEFMKKDSRIRLIQQPKNCGDSCSRNVGNAAARGKYIAVMDSDDMSYALRLKKQVFFLNLHPETTVITANKEANDRPDYRNTSQQEILYRLHFDNIVGNPENMYRRDFVKKHNIKYNESYIAAGDYDFWKQIVFAGGKINRLPDIVIKYRVHGTNTPIYYRKMYEIRGKVSKEFLKKYGINWNGHHEPTCNILHQMIQNYDKANFLSLPFLQRKADTVCQKELQQRK